MNMKTTGSRTSKYASKLNSLLKKAIETIGLKRSTVSKKGQGRILLTEEEQTECFKQAILQVMGSRKAYTSEEMKKIKKIAAKLRSEAIVKKAASAGKSYKGYGNLGKSRSVQKKHAEKMSLDGINNDIESTKYQNYREDATNRGLLPIARDSSLKKHAKLTWKEGFDPKSILDIGNKGHVSDYILRASQSKELAEQIENEIFKDHVELATKDNYVNRYNKKKRLSK